jgi:hypothetical protein
MPVKEKPKMPTTVSARLWPQKFNRLKAVAEYLTAIGDGSRASFADAICWLLDLPQVDKIVQGQAEVDGGR